MKIQLAELRNKPIREVVQSIVSMTPEEVEALHEEIASHGLPPVPKNLPDPQHGVVAAFLKSELASNTSLFVTACAAVQLPGKKAKGIPPTKRQASKWLHRKGLAYKQGRFGGNNGAVNV